MDFRRDEFDGSQNFELSFPKWLEVLILEKKVALRGYSRPTADEGIQDVLVVVSNLSHKTSMHVSFVTSVLRFVALLVSWQTSCQKSFEVLIPNHAKSFSMQSMNFHLGMRMPPGRRFAVSSAVRSADLQHLMKVRGKRRDRTTR